MFEVDFDDPDAAARKLAEEEAAHAEAEALRNPPEPEPEPEPEIPTFSEEDVEAARQEGYQQGHKDGMAEMAQGSENTLAQALKNIETTMTSAFQSHAAANAKMVSDGTHLAVALVNKLFPHMKHRHGTDEVEHLVEEALQRITDEPKILIQVAPDIVDEVKEKVQSVTRTNGFEGRVIVRGEKTIEIGDCNIQWGEGGAERNAARLWQIIDEVVVSHIGESEYYPAPAPSAPAETAPASSAPEGPAIEEGANTEEPVQDDTVEDITPAEANGNADENGEEAETAEIDDTNEQDTEINDTDKTPDGV